MEITYALPRTRRVRKEMGAKSDATIYVPVESDGVPQVGDRIGLEELSVYLIVKRLTWHVVTGRHIVIVSLVMGPRK